MERYVLPQQTLQPIHGVAFNSFLDLSRLHEMIAYAEARGVRVVLVGYQITLIKGEEAEFYMFWEKINTRHIERFLSGERHHHHAWMYSMLPDFVRDCQLAPYDGFLEELAISRVYSAGKQLPHIRACLEATKKQLSRDIRGALTAASLSPDTRSLVMLYLAELEDFFEWWVHLMLQAAIPC